MISADLTGKRSIVSGGASGIGLGVTRTFAANGSTVAIADLPGERLAGTVRTLQAEGLDVFAAPCDLRDNDSVAAMVEAAADRMGGIDYLLNIAGHPVTLKPIPASDLESQTEEMWAEALSINLLSAFRTAKAAAPYLKASRGRHREHGIHVRVARRRLQLALQRRQGRADHAHQGARPRPGPRGAGERHLAELRAPRFHQLPDPLGDRLRRLQIAAARASRHRP